MNKVIIRILKIRITFAYFSSVGTTVIWKDWLTICVLGWWIKFIISLSNFVDISSCPQLNLGFSLLVALITWADLIGSRNILFTLGLFRYYVCCLFFVVFFVLGTFWEVYIPIFIKYLLNSSVIFDLPVIFWLFICHFIYLLLVSIWSRISSYSIYFHSPRFYDILIWLSFSFCYRY